MSQYIGTIYKEQFIAITLTDRIEKSDCVILLEGDGYTRIKKSCQLIKEGFAEFLIFSGGSLDLSYGSYPYDMCAKAIENEGITENKLILELNSKNTRQQAEMVLDICQFKKWSSMLLVATHYHQFRAFLTFLKILEERGLERVIKIYNAPVVNADWFEENVWGRRIDIMQNEFDKIELHCKNGHLSDYKTAIQYYQWRDKI